MWKIVLAFGIGAAAGWFARPAAETPGAPRGAATSAPALRSSPRRPRTNVATATPTTSGDGAVKPADAAYAAPSNGDVGSVRGDATFEQLLDRARTDRDQNVRSAALDHALDLALAGKGDMDRAAAEVVAWIHDSDPVKRSFGLDRLWYLDARGADVARELVDHGGLTAERYGAAVTALLAARRFERLVPDDLDDDSRVQLSARLDEVLEADASLAPRVIAVLREAGPPSSKFAASEYFWMALLAHAPQIARDAAKSNATPVVARVEAVRALLKSPDERVSAVALAGEILADRTTSPTARRQLVEELGPDLVGKYGDAGIAAVRFVAEHDESLGVRDVAAKVLGEGARR